MIFLLPPVMQLGHFFFVIVTRCSPATYIRIITVVFCMAKVSLNYNDYNANKGNPAYY